MDPIIQLLIIIGISVVLALLIVALVVRVFMRMAFNKRGDGSPVFRYLEAEDFSGLVSVPIKFLGNKKQVLRGYLYYCGAFKTFNELVIFAHGIGAGHTAYTTEINRLAQEGFLVLAFDYTGCALSSGTAMKSLIQALADMDYALRYVESRPDLKDLKRFVIGHSWGGFVALASLLLKHRIDKVVSMSAFVSPTSVVVANRPGLYPLYPFIFMNGFWRYGKYALCNGLKAVRRSEIPLLIIHGQKDAVIKPKHSVERLAKTARKNANVEILYVEDRGHLPYLSKRGEEYLRKVQIDKNVFRTKGPVADYDIDYQLITEEDEEVMKKIAGFLKK
ncbi:MAG: alpha/beta fold hydrolase [Bacilli bacterium]|jgi:hypothetical protein